MRQAPLTDDGSSDGERPTAIDADEAGHCADKARTEELLHSEVTGGVIGSFYTVYDKFGYGFLENVYCGALGVELRRRGHRVSRELLTPIFYEGVQIARYRMDFVVDDVVVLEVKSTELLNPNDKRQLLNYLRATRFNVGLLLHFGPKPKFCRLVSSEEKPAVSPRSARAVSGPVRDIAADRDAETESSPDRDPTARTPVDTSE
jgi:GxxExxY protein